MSQTLKTSVAVIGVDIGKNSFHLVGQDRRGCDGNAALQEVHIADDC